MKAEFHFDENSMLKPEITETSEHSYNCHIFYDKKKDEWTVTIQMGGENISKTTHKNLAAAVLYSAVEWA